MAIQFGPRERAEVHARLDTILLRARQYPVQARWSRDYVRLDSHARVSSNARRVKP